MKFQIILIASFTLAIMAAPQELQDDSHAETLRMEVENNGVDNYSFAYDTSNGISRSEHGELKTTDEGSAIVVQGTSSWTAPDGKRYEIAFTADETGYHPSFKLVA